MANGNGDKNGNNRAAWDFSAPNSLTPSIDQVSGQLRVLIPALGTIATTAGLISADKVGPIVSNSLIAIGPIMYLAAAIWSLIANSRRSILASAAKPVAPNVPPPEIVLSVQEAPLAAVLPDNVSTTETKKVVSCSGKSP